MSTPVFIVIDIQNDYFPDGAMALDQVELAARVGKRALDHARANNLPVIIVQHIAVKPEATFFRPNTLGAEIHPWFVPKAGEQHVIKHFPNAFRDTDLAERLQRLGADELVICGMMTHMCIDSTVRAASDQGYSVTLLGDATATRSLSFQNRMAPALAVQTSILAALHGSFADVVTVAKWTGTAY